MATWWRVAIMCKLSSLSKTSIKKKLVFVSYVVTYEREKIVSEIQKQYRNCY